MPITPADIENKTFSQARKGGYAPNEVDEFLTEVGQDVERMLVKIADQYNRLQAAEKANAEMQASLAAAQAELAEAQAALEAAKANPAVAPVIASPVAEPAAADQQQATQQQLASVLIVAQQTADQMVTEANATAEKTINDARARAERITADAASEAQEIKRQAYEARQAEIEEIERLKISREKFRQEYQSLIQKFSDAASANFVSFTLEPAPANLFAPAAPEQPSMANPYGAQVASVAIDDLD